MKHIINRNPFLLPLCLQSFFYLFLLSFLFPFSFWYLSSLMFFPFYFPSFSSLWSFSWRRCAAYSFLHSPVHSLFYSLFPFLVPSVSKFRKCAWLFQNNHSATQSWRNHYYFRYSGCEDGFYCWREEPVSSWTFIFASFGPFSWTCCNSSKFLELLFSLFVNNHATTHSWSSHRRFFFCWFFHCFCTWFSFFVVSGCFAVRSLLCLLWPVWKFCLIITRGRKEQNNLSNSVSQGDDVFELSNVTWVVVVDAEKCFIVLAFFTHSDRAQSALSSFNIFIPIHWKSTSFNPPSSMLEAFKSTINDAMRFCWLVILPLHRLFISRLLLLPLVVVAFPSSLLSFRLHKVMLSSSLMELPLFITVVNTARWCASFLLSAIRHPLVFFHTSWIVLIDFLFLLWGPFSLLSLHYQRILRVFFPFLYWQASCSFCFPPPPLVSC